MCDLCILSAAPTTDVLIDGFPVSICVRCKTALMIHMDPWMTLVDYESDKVYRQASLTRLSLLA